MTLRGLPRSFFAVLASSKCEICSEDKCRGNQNSRSIDSKMSKFVQDMEIMGSFLRVFSRGILQKRINKIPGVSYEKQR